MEEIRKSIRKYKNLIGEKFNCLTVITEAERTQDKHNIIINWVCQCICGNEKIVSGNNLKRGNVKSCGCQKRKMINEGIKKWSEENFPLSTEYNLYHHYKIGAPKRGYVFELDFEFFCEKIKEVCFYCKRVPYNIHKSKPKSQRYILYNGLDRIDNKEGYTPDNIVTCCKECNFLKGTYNHDDFIRIIKLIAVNF